MKIERQPTEHRRENKTIFGQNVRKKGMSFFSILNKSELYHNLEKTMIIQMSPPQRGLL